MKYKDYPELKYAKNPRENPRHWKLDFIINKDNLIVMPPVVPFLFSRYQQYSIVGILIFYV
jgi:hypothetical protein